MCESMSCPPVDEYRKLACGEAAPLSAERLLAHLEECETCARVVGTLPEPDTLAELIRQGSTVRDWTFREPVAGLIDRLSQLRPDASAKSDRPQAAQPLTQRVLQSNEAHPNELYDWLAPSDNEWELGRLGPYSVLNVIGAGGMGVVFRARDPQLQRIVALKAMLPVRASRDGARQRFLREARAIAAIKHDHIVSVYQVGEDQGVPFLSMELLEGEPLDKLLERESKLPVMEVLRIGREIALGLSAAHKRGLIHRDIKPANIWLESETGRVKILDFGLARGDRDECRLTHEGAIVGTPEYMSPEQGQGREIDHRCDLFSLGCVLYRMATAELPFSGSDVVSTLLAGSTHHPPSPSSLDTAMPPALSGLIMALLAKEPAERPPSAQAVATSLEDIAKKVSSTVETQPRNRWNWSLAITVGACVLVSISMLCAVAFVRVKTQSGTIVVEGLPADAHVLVDGETTKMRYGPGGDWIEVQSVPGEHTLQITARGFKAKTQDVTLGTDERKPIRIHLEPLTEEPNSVGSGDPKRGRRADGPLAAISPFDAERAKEHQQAWAEHLGLPVEFTNSIGVTFRLIPPGEVLLGSTPEEIDAAKPHLYTGVDATRPERAATEGPQRRVVLTKPFYLGIHEVTQRQYRRATGTNPSIHANADNPTENDDLPVDNVVWHEAVSCCNLFSKTEQLSEAYRITALGTTPTSGVGYRLPTEVEWEFACRAGTTTLFWSGDDEESLMRAAWYGANNEGNSPKPVGTRVANPFGLFDMHGNVWEWVNDGWDPQFYERLIGASAIDPRCQNAIDDWRVIRGGDYFMSPAECRSACRDGQYAGDRYDDLGFRMALSVEAVAKLAAAKPTNSGTP